MIEHEQLSTPRLVLVAGAGRSGTSTIGGIFHRLGFHVPEPTLGANESNPRGFYESWWPVKFHQRLMKRAVIEQTDGRPVAGQLVAEQVDDRAREQLHDWLADQFEGRRRVMVKDPRAAWAPLVWADVAEKVGADLNYVTMIRHPGEVVGSRSTYYAANRPGMSPREFATWNLCGWINQNLTLEAQIRDRARAYVQYAELIADWRPVVTSLIGDLSLGSDLLTPEAVEEIDAFVEPGLKRHAAEWGDDAPPAALIEVAEGVWGALVALSQRHGHDAEAERELDRWGARYRQLYADSQAIAHDHTTATARAAEASVREAWRREVEQVRAARANTPAARARRQAGRVARRVRPALRSVGGRVRGGQG